MKRAACLALLLFCGWANAQSVTLPETVTGAPGQWIILVPKAVDGGAVKWRLDPALQDVPLDDLFPGSKPKGKVVSTISPGRYKYEAWTAKGDVASDIAVGWVVILGPSPTPVPPTPVPPIPIPPVPPPPSPSPMPVSGFRVLVVFDQVGGTAVLTKQQYNELYGVEVANYLNAKCAKADGQPEWRIWNKGTIMTNAPKLWQDVMARPRQNLPWIVISTGASTPGFEGPLPDGGLIDLLRKWGG